MKISQSRSQLIIAITLSLIVGFMGGVVVAVYRTPSIVSQLPTSQENGPTQKEKEKHVRHMEAEAAKKPQDANAWIELGNAYFDIEATEKAIDAYLKALNLSPNNPGVLNDLGILYRRAKQPQKALESFDKAAKLDPTHVQSRFNKGVVLFHNLNDKEGAIKAWQEVAKLQPDFSPATGQTIQQLLESLK